MHSELRPLASRIVVLFAATRSEPHRAALAVNYELEAREPFAGIVVF